MPTDKIIRPAGNRTDQEAEQLVAPIVPAGRRYPQTIRLSDTAEAVIADFAVDLMLDELQLWQLPPSLFEFFTYAYESGRTAGLDSRDGLDRLKFEADRWYWCFTNRKTPGEFYKHLTNELWSGATS